MQYSPIHTKTMQALRAIVQFNTNRYKYVDLEQAGHIILFWSCVSYILKPYDSKIRYYPKYLMLLLKATVKSYRRISGD